MVDGCPRCPGAGGLAATSRLTAAQPDTAVLVLTMLDDDSVLPAIRAGARGFLLKDAGVDDLVRAITAVHRGETILSKRAADRVQRRLSEAPATSTRPFPQLTDREHDLLREILRGRNSPPSPVIMHEGRPVDSHRLITMFWGGTPRARRG